MSTTPQDLVAAFDSTGLFHAYGPATDTQQLADLFGDENARETAADYLYSAILHQSTPWTATAPVVTLLVECLALDGAASARQEILEFCTDVAEAVTGTDPASTPESVRAEVEARRADLSPEAITAWEQIAATGDEDAYQEAFEDDQVGEAMFSGVLLAILDAMPRWAASALAWIDDPDPAIAFAAARCVVACGPQGSSDLIPLLREWTRTDRPDWQRAYAAHLLGQLGEQVRPFLADRSRAVRFLAALAPGLAEDEDADRVLVEALRDPAALDEVFEKGSALWDWAPSVAAIPRVVSRVGATTGFDEADLVDVAIASARTSGSMPGDWAWGKYLSAVLRDARPGQPLGPHPRRYLAALVELDPDAEEIWNPHHGNNMRIFRQVGLPHDREACRELAQGAPWPASTQE